MNRQETIDQALRQGKQAPVAPSVARGPIKEPSKLGTCLTIFAALDAGADPRATEFITACKTNAGPAGEVYCATAEALWQAAGYPTDDASLAEITRAALAAN